MSVQDDETQLEPAADPAPPAEIPPAPWVGIPAIEETDFIGQLADRTAAKLAEGLLRLPPSVRASLGKIHPAGFYLAPTSCGYGPDRFEFRAYARPTGIELAIHDSAGDRMWWAVLL